MQWCLGSLTVLRVFACAASIPFLNACGGGSGSGNSAVAIVNDPPIFAVPTQNNLLEGAPGLTLFAIDANNDNVIFSIVGGVDRDAFSITNSTFLTFVNESDYENPGDTDKNNEYLVAVRAFDGLAATTAEIKIVILDALEGRVVDGPISGASIFVDLDGDSLEDSDESTGKTNESGYFKIPQVTPVQDITPKIISYGGTDSKTGKILENFVLLADLPNPLVCISATCPKPDSVFITPLTALLSTTINANDKEKILEAFGISLTPENLLVTDVWKSAEAGSQVSKKIQRINQKIALLIQAANTLSKVNGLAESILVLESLSTEILSLINSQDSIDLTNAETIPNERMISAISFSVNIVCSTVDLTSIPPLSVRVMNI